MQCVALHHIALHCIVHYITLHYIILHYSTLKYIIFPAPVWSPEGVSYGGYALMVKRGVILMYHASSTYTAPQVLVWVLLVLAFSYLTAT